MTPRVQDYGHREADRELTALMKRLHKEYRQASISLQEKITAYLEQFEKEDAEKRALYDSGEMSHEAFIKWRNRKIVETKQWRGMLEQITNDMTNSNKIAADMINDTLPTVYAENHNYGTFEAEHGSGYDTTYTLYDRDTVARLLKGKEEILPYKEPSVNVKKDKLWNRQHLQSALLQGILQGEPMKDIADRFQRVSGMNESAAMRNARTAVTGAENAGRIESYKRAERFGIQMQQVWMATLDGRTRDSHAMLDGEHQPVGKKFSNGCRYPGDPQGRPEEIYNCRCTLVAVVEGADPYDPSMRPSEYLREQGLTYGKWKQMHGERYYSKLFANRNNANDGILLNLSGSSEKVQPRSVQEPKYLSKQTGGRPENEPEFLRKYEYIGIPEDGTDIYKLVNPNYGADESYNNNCVKCVGAEEMCWRGYNVEAMPYDANDPVKMDGGSYWDVDVLHYSKDPYGFVAFKSPDDVKSKLAESFIEWGDGSRAMMAILRKNGTGHAIVIRREGNKIFAEDPQSGNIVSDIDGLVNSMSTLVRSNFLMRIDNRPVNENIKYVVKNKERR